MVVIAVLLAGCFEYEEEVWIENDLSGRIVVTYSFPLDKGSSEEKDKPAIRASEGIKVGKTEMYVKDGKSCISVELLFDNIKNLEQFTWTEEEDKGGGDKNEELIPGTIELRSEKGRLVLIRHISAEKKEGESAPEPPAAQDKLVMKKTGPDESMSSYIWHFTYHLPTKILDVRPGEMSVSKDKRTAFLETDLYKIDREGLHIEIRAKPVKKKIIRK